MAISNELSSEIATALMLETKERSPKELNDLKNILLEVHSALQSLSRADHRERLKRFSAARSAINTSYNS